MTIILLVEDDQLISMALADGLNSAGYTVHCEYEGLPAIAVAEKLQLSAAIIDIGLPDCSGSDVATTLRSRFPNLPIIVFTGDAYSDLVRSFRKINIDVLEKPSEDKVLFALLEARGVRNRK